MAYLKKIAIKLNNFEIERFVRIHKAKEKKKRTQAFWYTLNVFITGVLVINCEMTLLILRLKEIIKYNIITEC